MGLIDLPSPLFTLNLIPNLDLCSISRLKRTNKRLNNLLESDEVWRNVITSVFNIPHQKIRSVAQPKVCLLKNLYNISGRTNLNLYLPQKIIGCYSEENYSFSSCSLRLIQSSSDPSKGN